jgi:hypothetical protein
MAGLLGCAVVGWWSRSSAVGTFPHDHFGVLGCFDDGVLRSCEPSRITGPEGVGAVEGDRASGHEDVDERRLGKQVL